MVDLLQSLDVWMVWPIIALVVGMGLILFTSIGLGSAVSRYFYLAVFTIVVAVVVKSVDHIQLLAKVPDSLFSGTIILDRLSLFMTVFLTVFLFGVLVVSVELWRKPAWEWPIYLCLLIGSLIGMILLSSTRHLLFFAIAFELASMPSYVLVGFRRFAVKSAEGSAKYVIFGAVSSAIMMYGISLLYGLSGSFDFETISLRLFDTGFQLTGLVGLVCVLLGLSFKISLVPAHFWCPDAFEAAGADVAAWLSVASKSAALVAMARLVQTLSWVAVPAFSPGFVPNMVRVISIIAIVTMTLANLSAYWQSSVKRLLAYSSIAHAGYMVCGLTVLSDNTGIAAIVAYIVVYLFMNLGAFTVVGLVERETGSDDIRNFDGLGSRSPGMAVLMMFFLFSLVGLPPLGGFAVKWILISSLWSHHMTVLVVAILFNTLLSLFYYMRIAQAMYFRSSDAPEIKVPGSVGLVMTVSAAGLVVLFVGWGLLNQAGNQLLASVFG